MKVNYFIILLLLISLQSKKASAQSTLKKGQNSVLGLIKESCDNDESSLCLNEIQICILQEKLDQDCLLLHNQGVTCLEEYHQDSSINESISDFIISCLN